MGEYQPDGAFAKPPAGAKVTVLHLEPSLHEQLTSVADSLGISMAHLIREGLAAYIGGCESGAIDPRPYDPQREGA